MYPTEPDQPQSPRSYEPQQHDDQTRTYPEYGQQPAALTKPRRNRIALVVTAAVLGVTLVGVGGAYAYSRGLDAGAARADTMQWDGGADSSQGYGNQGYGNQGFGGQNSPGNGGSGTGQVPDLGGQSLPGYGQSQGQDSSEVDVPDATDEQETGMVEISSTLANGTAAGTGMVLTSDGTVVTNHHVVAGAMSIKVTVVSTGKTYTADYVGGDSTADVAVLELEDASGLDTVDIADDAAATGDSVTAVGDAGGDGGSLSAAAGTVTALHQSITVSDDDGGSNNLTNLIEVDADVIPGDSGGALLDADNEVVGMNVAASSGTADITGYAIPIKTALSVAEQISSGSDGTSGTSGYLGVELGDSSATIAGVVSGTAADEAGLAAGDTITSVDGQQISTGEELRAAIAAHAGGDQVKLTWVDASGQQHSATVTLGSTVS
ncbi:MAG: trypsin-like peptidase domain-containing protein [Nocardioidaceae bacterium]